MLHLLLSFFYFSTLIFLPSCFHIGMEHEFSAVHRSTHERTGDSIGNKPAEQLLEEEHVLEELYGKALTREEAITIALKNNSSLQAFIENLGVAKAELVQAGFLTNPSLDVLYTVQEDLEAPIVDIVRYNIDDWWKKPFETKVACDALKVVMSEVEIEVLRVKRDTVLAFNNCMFAHDVANVAKEFVQELTKLRKLIIESDEESPTYTIDLSIAEIILGRETNRHYQFEAEHGVACAELRRIIGMEVSKEQIHTKERILDYIPVLPNIDLMMYEAVDLNPRVIAAAYNVEVARHGLSLQRASVFRDVRFGFLAERTPDSPNNLGPAFQVEVPIFDFNQAQIARADYLLERAKKLHLNTVQDVQRDILAFYFQLEGFLRIINVFENLIRPAFEKGIDFVINKSKEFVSSDNDLNIVVLLRALDRFYEAKIEYLQTHKLLLDTQAELEFAAGRRLVEFGGGLRKAHLKLQY